jgi:hypothetical protein
MLALISVLLNGASNIRVGTQFLFQSEKSGFSRSRQSKFNASSYSLSSLFSVGSLTYDRGAGNTRWNHFEICKQWSSKHALNKCWNTNISLYLETSCGQNSNLYLNVVHFFNTSVNKTSVAAQDSCFPAYVSNLFCSIGISK